MLVGRVRKGVEVEKGERKGPKEKLESEEERQVSYHCSRNLK